MGTKMNQEKHGVLLVNLGTPTSSVVKYYLEEFLGDGPRS
jgi:protoheme ferro-lyase